MNTLDRFDRKTVIASLAWRAVPDALIALLAMLFTGDARTFWWVFLGLWAVAILLRAKHELWAWLVWHAWGRGRVITRAVMGLEHSAIPRPRIAPTDASEFLEATRSDPTQSVETRIAAAQMQKGLESTIGYGLVAAMRVHQAWDVAIVRWAVDKPTAPPSGMGAQIRRSRGGERYARVRPPAR